MDSPISLVHIYSQRTHQPISETWIPFVSFELCVGTRTVKVESDKNKKTIKSLAYQEFINQNPDVLITNKRSIREKYNEQPGYDYIEYSEQHILKECIIHWNDSSFFNTHHDVVAFDSENKPPSLAQFCVGNDVYLFDLPLYKSDVLSVLRDQSICKIVCDASAEERDFGKIENIYDVQNNKNKSLLTCIQEQFNIQLKKNKLIHVRGWHKPLSADHILYAAADVVWLWQLWCDRQPEGSRCMALSIEQTV